MNIRILLCFLIIILSQANGKIQPPYFIKGYINCNNSENRMCKSVSPRDSIFYDEGEFLEKAVALIPFRIKSQDEQRYEDNKSGTLTKIFDIPDSEEAFTKDKQLKESRYYYSWNTSIISPSPYQRQPILLIKISKNQERLTYAEINNLINFNKIAVYNEKNNQLIGEIDFGQSIFKQSIVPHQEGEIIDVRINAFSINGKKLEAGNYYFLIEASVRENYYDDISISYQLEEFY